MTTPDSDGNVFRKDRLEELDRTAKLILSMYNIADQITLVTSLAAQVEITNKMRPGIAKWNDVIGEYRSKHLREQEVVDGE